ncbi:hypothetical protein EMIHUDRAFT_455411 [Emiliania huxleyi CCMP1516]|uniref:C3H1-type domain-containing protein n=2 Tax=Emiliania huxleyi TaxID=2903 RepID=A0A0D3K654_EMIH1|nr:hypothetical protein EMIHUDRAFT_456383 [Emiliania huxleyi CCMP1516]XP_005787547.1 hypothetical protein EMIHUDRAFT_455411 [Emiliania huxleyi CCMP1516]EOD31239.1 hypothetical protein EMIHUDRAFT_456383 [Emiliania huxleyi CCMP1516]EOD35118.1 hypothetical protein EMIHUDRAFT_455411 [Emiliania huxleyi CCMP1516]|eukprot:XP_005783668.1 hypothetical protein EMIHUDRAFT_456383 [Emiliania huxleyi CCMP1516]
MSNKPSSGQRAVQPLANSNSKANRPSSGQKPTGSPSAKRGSRASAAAAAARAKDPLRYKTVECENWARDGKCPYGARCQFAHGAHELRTVLPAAPLGSPTTSGSSRRSSNAAPALYSSLFSPESPRSPISLTPSSLPPPRRWPAPMPPCAHSACSAASSGGEYGYLTPDEAEVVCNPETGRVSHNTLSVRRTISMLWAEDDHSPAVTSRLPAAHVH